MQNIERYFGYKVVLTDKLDPARVSVLKEKAELIMALNAFSEDDFVVYFHQLTLMPNDDHFSNNFQLEEKIKRLDLSFSVNKKQIKNGKIKLYNFLIKDNAEPSNYKEFGHAHSINYMIQGSALKGRYGFRNEIVTFVHKELRRDHRKLKVSMACQPTDFFREQLTNQKDMHLTQLDFKLESKHVHLLKAKTNYSAIPKHKGDMIVNNTYINNGQAGAMGENAKTDNSTFNQQVNSGLDLNEMVSALGKLRQAMKATAEDNNIEQDKALSAITFAEDAAKEGDEAKTLEYLKKGGKWAFEVSEKVGTTVLSAYLKATLGL